MCALFLGALKNLHLQYLIMVSYSYFVHLCAVTCSVQFLSLSQIGKLSLLALSTKHYLADSIHGFVDYGAVVIVSNPTTTVGESKIVSYCCANALESVILYYFHIQIRISSKSQHTSIFHCLEMSPHLDNSLQ